MFGSPNSDHPLFLLGQLFLNFLHKMINKTLVYTIMFITVSKVLSSIKYCIYSNVWSQRLS